MKPLPRSDSTPSRTARWYYTAQRIADRASWRWFEARTGVVTQASIHARQLGHGEEEYGYQPIDRRSLEASLRELGVAPNDVFIDLGCGMGRAVVIAAMHERPFRRVIGVEFSAPLASTARQNIGLAKSRFTCNEVEIVQANAVQYELPSHVSVAFMFNPFGGDVLESVLDNISRSLEQYPRRLSIIYSIPNNRDDPLERRDWLQKSVRIATPHAPWQKMTLYQHTPELAEVGGGDARVAAE